jgi:hypothetical protein
MVTDSVAAVVHYLVSRATARAGRLDGDRAIPCDDSIAIFDELDSLNREEFTEVYAVYLVGSGTEQDFGQARKTASVAEFLPLEAVVQDQNLHLALSRGIELGRHYAQLG